VYFVGTAVPGEALASASAKPMEACPMANIAESPPAVSGEFRIGQVFSQAAAVLSRNFLFFFVVTLVAALPRLLLSPTPGTTAGAVGREALGLFLSIVLNMVGQAMVVHAAFQDMRNRPVSIGETLQAALGRLLSIVGVGVCMAISLMAVAVVPAAAAGLILYAARSLFYLVTIGVGVGIGLALLLLSMWLVAMPACVVERRRPLSSIGRSSKLTKGHRWKVFGMVLLLFGVGYLINAAIRAGLGLTGSFVLVTLGTLAWTGVWGAFYASMVIVTYHDLRVVKEGVDVHEIAAVFD
jgi:hypothetical protein